MKYDIVYKEDHISQIPALQLLQAMGYNYLSPDEAESLRDRKLSNVILESVLAKQLAFINEFAYKGRRYKFTEGAVSSAIQALKNYRYDGLVHTNEQIYDLLCLGKSFEQTVEDDTKSFTLKYIDWINPENNIYHVCEEFPVERSGSYDTYRPDIVLFVNGIPLVVIECKRPEEKDSIQQAVSQHIRNQKDDGITRLFVYSQMLLAVNKNEAKYATTNTPLKFWSVWKEFDKELLDKTDFWVKASSQNIGDDKIYQGRFRYIREFFLNQAASGGREITEQDRTLSALCYPRRMLELIYQFSVFEAGERKIARYQQFLAVKKTIQRVLQTGPDGKRTGGVIWHTQGSGKSLTMVMLAKALSLEPSITNPRIVVVTDRKDLDDQIEKTFHKCGRTPVRATTGRNLSELISENKANIIMTLVHKFQSVIKRSRIVDESRDVFMLVDESHRTQYGNFHVQMHKVFPFACYIGFTGTPLMKKEKNTADRFGGLIDIYNIQQAVADKAVVPLLYEGRHVEQKVLGRTIDTWWTRICEKLSPEQQKDLKIKFSRTDQLNKAEKKIQRIAYDLSEHFKKNWQGTGFKGQLTADSKASALRFKRFLDEFGLVSSEVLISAPDQREGYTDTEEESTDEVVAFWKKMMKRFGTEEVYNRQIINKFKSPEEPDIIIVVDKLLTGFDAPRNAVLYIARNLRDHTLLQAIARVNRLYDGKEFGFIIDYYGVLGELDKALTAYGSLDGFDNEDITDTLINIKEVIDKLPQKHSDLWDIFKTIANKYDAGAYEVHLADDEIRGLFYRRLTEYANCLNVAFSSVVFHEKTSESKIEKYKSDLKFFVNLRGAVRRRYAESVDFGEYEPRIRRLIDEYVGAEDIIKITDLVDIFDKEAFEKEIEKVEGKAGRADTIANRTKKAIHLKMDEDPAFYKKFSKMLQETIEAYRLKRISETEYLKKVTEIMDHIRNKDGENIPEPIAHSANAQAYYGIIAEFMQKAAPHDIEQESLSAEVALAVDAAVENNKIVNWERNLDVQKKIAQEIDDYFFQLKEVENITFELAELDEVIDLLIQTAIKRAIS